MLAEVWLSHSDWWFHSTPETDEAVRREFGPWGELHKHAWDLWDEVLLYDQLSCHYFRNQPDVIKGYRQMAFERATLALEHWRRQPRHDWPSPEKFVFLLLPLRHQKTRKHIEEAITYLQEHPKWPQNPPIFQRFYRASIEQLADFYEEYMESKNGSGKVMPWATWKDILEFCPSGPVGETGLPLTTFDMPLTTFDMPLTTFDMPASAMEEDLIFLRGEKGVLVSLSGGLDSMVLLWRFSIAARTLGIPCSALHINYNNRESCSREVEFLQCYCKILQVPLIIRHIREISRTQDIYRDFYEEYTRKVRFDAYMREVPSGGIVLLGHHEGDLLENMWTNIRKERNYENLGGMFLRHEERNVRIGRPFLGLRKAEIELFARERNIPFLEDSTPKWSERGRMRDQLIPFVDQFDPTIQKGLLHLSQRLSNMHDLLRKQLWEPYYQQVIYNENQNEIYFVKQNGMFEWGLPFWQQFFVEQCRKLGVEYPSKKAIQCWILKKGTSLTCFNSNLQVIPQKDAWKLKKLI